MKIERKEHLDSLISSQHNGMIKVVTGIRRCGKSYLLFNLFYNHLLGEGVRPDHIVTVDLEDRRNARLRNPDELLAYIDAQMVDKEMYYILLDEVQTVGEFEDVLNSYLKVKNADVYVTGSNSRFLSSDVITEFRGRGDEIHIAPLSFREFSSVFPDRPREQLFLEYCTYGGLPMVVLTEEPKKKIQYLKNLFSKTYLTDIKERYDIKNDDVLEELIDILASGIGSLMNQTKIANTFESVKHTKVSHNTIKQYLNLLQDAYMVSKSIRYDIKGKRYIDTPAKYYFTDMGLRNVRLKFRQLESGHNMENVIYNELLMRGMEVDVGMVMLNAKNANGVSERRQLEVDFVCNQGSKRCYIQSAYRMDDPAKVEQELRSLRLIDDSFSKFVITERPTMRHQDDDGIIHMDIYDFLLNADSLVV